MEGHLGKCGDVVNVEFREEIGSRVGRLQCVQGTKGYDRSRAAQYSKEKETKLDIRS